MQRQCTSSERQSMSSDATAIPKAGFRCIKFDVRNSLKFAEQKNGAETRKSLSDSFNVRRYKPAILIQRGCGGKS
jgi:hypothetical protein